MSYPEHCVITPESYATVRTSIVLFLSTAWCQWWEVLVLVVDGRGQAAPLVHDDVRVCHTLLGLEQVGDEGGLHRGCGQHRVVCIYIFCRCLCWRKSAPLRRFETRGREVIT